MLINAGKTQLKTPAYRLLKEKPKAMRAPLKSIAPGCSITNSLMSSIGK